MTKEQAYAVRQREKARYDHTLAWCSVCHKARPIAEFVGKRGLTKSCVTCRSRATTAGLNGQAVIRALKELYRGTETHSA